MHIHHLLIIEYLEYTCARYLYYKCNKVCIKLTSRTQKWSSCQCFVFKFETCFSKHEDTVHNNAWYTLVFITFLCGFISSRSYVCDFMKDMCVGSCVRHQRVVLMTNCSKNKGPNALPLLSFLNMWSISKVITFAPNFWSRKKDVFK